MKDNNATNYPQGQRALIYKFPIFTLGCPHPNYQKRVPFFEDKPTLNLKTQDPVVVERLRTRSKLKDKRRH